MTVPESHNGTPECPKCGAHMVRRSGSHYDAFWGCSGYPSCRGTRAIDEYGKPEPTVDEIESAAYDHVRRISVS